MRRWCEQRMAEGRRSPHAHVQRIRCLASASARASSSCPNASWPKLTGPLGLWVGRSIDKQGMNHPPTQFRPVRSTRPLGLGPRFRWQSIDRVDRPQNRRALANFEAPHRASLRPQDLANCSTPTPRKPLDRHRRGSSMAEDQDAADGGFLATIARYRGPSPWLCVCWVRVRSIDPLRTCYLPTCMHCGVP